MKCRVLTAKDCRANRNCVVFFNLAAWGISAASNYDVKKKMRKVWKSGIYWGYGTVSKGLYYLYLIDLIDRLNGGSCNMILY